MPTQSALADGVGEQSSTKTRAQHRSPSNGSVFTSVINALDSTGADSCAGTLRAMEPCVADNRVLTLRISRPRDRGIERRVT
jgi:hypothetical protein